MPKRPVVHLKVAEPPGKREVLAMLDELRVEVESGHTIAIVVITVSSARQWSTLCNGDISVLEMCGLIGCAHNDILSTTRSAKEYR